MTQSPNPPAGSPTGRFPSASDAAVAVILLAIAVGLRWPRMGDRLEMDESATLGEHIQKPVLEIARTFGAARNHPLYSLLAHACWRMWPGSDVAVRVPAFAAGVAAVLVLWWGLRTRAGSIPAAWAGLTLAVSTPHVVYSARARGYSMLALGCVASSWLLLRAVEHGRLRDWAGYVAVLVLTVYAHLWGLFLVASQGVFVLAWTALALRGRGVATSSERRTPGHILAQYTLAAVSIAALVVVLYASMIPDIAAMLGQGRGDPIWSQMAGALVWNANFGLPEANLFAWTLSAFVVAVPLLAGVLLRQPAAALAGLTLVVSLTIVAAFQPGNFYARFLIFLVPCYPMLVGCGLACFPLLENPGVATLRWCAKPNGLSLLLGLVGMVLAVVALAMLVALNVLQLPVDLEPNSHSRYAWLALAALAAAQLAGGVSKRLRGPLAGALIVTLCLAAMDLLTAPPFITPSTVLAFSGGVLFLVWNAAELRGKLVSEATA